MEKYSLIGQWLYDLLIAIGLSDTNAKVWKVIVLSLLIIIIAYTVFRVSRFFVKRYLTDLIHKTTTEYDNYFLNNKVFNRVAYLIPAFILYFAFDSILHVDYAFLTPILQAFIKIYGIIIFLLIINGVIDSLHEIYKSLPIAESRHIKDYVQVLKIFIYSIGIILIISTVIQRSPIYLLSGLGAIAAVLLLIFKDTLLGFVASMQLSANKMVKPGDWITMNKYEADGTVLEITLHTVKVQNFDRTITTIPTYALVSNSFINWKGMLDSGGRRIKRHILIDINSIKFCNIDFLKKMVANPMFTPLLSDLIIAIKHDDIYSQLTNAQLFRHYTENYLKHHPDIAGDMLILVRELKITEKGLPIEIYAFSKNQNWIDYEKIQAGIFDHLLAIVNLFKLEVVQTPTGKNIENLK